VWKSLKSEGFEIGRERTARLMKKAGLTGVLRGRNNQPTDYHPMDVNVEDLVNRNFAADAPDKLWVADFTYVKTRKGWVYVAFITDVFSRRIIGFKVSKTMTKDMVMAAFVMAVFIRVQEGVTKFDGLIHHNDKGSQYTSDDFQELLRSSGVTASIGTVGDSYDNALAETINGLYKTELIKMRKVWKNYEEVNLETTKYIHWFNSKRISEFCNWQNPISFEKSWYNELSTRNCA
jgi:putative transposase